MGLPAMQNDNQQWDAALILTGLPRRPQLGRARSPVVLRVENLQLQARPLPVGDAELSEGPTVEVECFQGQAHQGLLIPQFVFELRLWSVGDSHAPVDYGQRPRQRSLEACRSDSQP